MLKSVSQFIAANPFLKNVGILTSGTVFAQGIMVLILPVLTRMYSPADFALLAVYTSIIGFISVFACLRFNIAIPLPEDDRVGMNLLVLALGSATLVSILIAVPTIAFSKRTASLLGQPAIEPYLWMIPLGVFVASYYDALQYWISRKRRFGLVTMTRLSRAIGGAGTQVGLGAFQLAPFGLIFGQLIYSGLGVLGLSRSLLKTDLTALQSVSSRGVFQAFKDFRRFPMVSVPESAFNTGGTEIPVLIISALAIGPEAGFLLLAMRVMGIPMGLIGSSVSQVFLVEGPQRCRNGSLGPFTKNLMWILFKLGAPPLILVGLMSPFLFPIVFGKDWLRAGELVAWMTPWFVLQFVASPVSTLFTITDRLATAMWLQIVGAVLRIGAVFIAASFFPAYIAETYALSGACFYGMYLMTLSRASESSIK